MGENNYRKTRNQHLKPCDEFENHKKPQNILNDELQKAGVADVESLENLCLMLHLDCPMSLQSVI